MIKKITIILVAFILLLVFLNPTMSDFKDYTGTHGGNDYMMKKESNFILWSIYTIGDERYLGIAKNFYQLKDKPMELNWTQ